ncbi:2-(3-amino-3-carboxypropyl)histidine synthase subunit 2 [Ischnura elegans]|uniref:2-(3-amino-3-carboxypropyl)histidine synthase subunit 2 n=1 Tax=Ischnura elegans TaxID=197161 RepID=UPI001ED8B177|nr:2-(3-amino-3-carboxypropyl)histidine synthase subunit 2 [Ischnura elegans]
MSSAFSSSETDALQRNVKSDGCFSTPLEQINVVYEIDKCISWIKRKNVDKVALQFPDEMLGDSANVARLIESLLGRKVYILGDTTYGSCCVDEIAAEHAGCDAVIHFGRSCLSPTKKLPVLHVFTPLLSDFGVTFIKLLDREDGGGLLEAFEAAFDDPSSTLLLAYDISVASLVKKIVQILSPKFTSLIISQLCVDTGLEKEFEKCGPFCQLSSKRGHSCTCLGRSFCLPVAYENDDPRIIPTLVFFGEDNITLDNLTLTLRGHPCFRCFVKDDGEITVQPRQWDEQNRFLRRRLYLVEKVREASVVGVVIGTLGREGFLASADRVMSIIRAHGRKCYLLAVGRPTPPKLANFLEVDVFVVIACPECARELDIRGEFHRPVVTPYEVEAAFHVSSSNEESKVNTKRWDQWGGLDFIPDFREFLPGGLAYSEEKDCSQSNEQEQNVTDVSLLSGKIRQICVSAGNSGAVGSDSEDGDCKDLAIRSEMAIDVVHVGGGGEFLTGRSWKGLELNKEENQSPSSVQLGRIGTASGYTIEKEALGGTKDQK